MVVVGREYGWWGGRGESMSGGGGKRVWVVGREYGWWEGEKSGGERVCVVGRVKERGWCGG